MAVTPGVSLGEHFVACNSRDTKEGEDASDENQFLVVGRSNR